MVLMGIWLSRDLNFNIAANLPLGRLTPFNTVRNSLNTLDHVTIRADEASFIHQIQTGTPNFIFPCLGLCQTTAAAFSSGNDVICTTGQETYQSGYTLQWGETLEWLSSANLRLVTQSNTTGTFEYVAGQPQGAAWVRAVIRNRTTNCSRLLNQVDVWVGVPETPRLSGGVQGCYFVITPNAGGATLFDWEVDNPNIAIGAYGSNSIAIHAADWVTLNLKQITVTCRAFNACNKGMPLERIQTFNRPNFPLCVYRVASPTLKAYPNPTNNLLNIAVENLNSPIEQVVVRNSIGTVVLQTATLDFTAEKTAVLSLTTLPEGIYFLTVSLQDGQQLSQKVVVQRSGVAN
jgi:hypothetical protein